MFPLYNNYITVPKINLEYLELLRPWGLRSSSLEAQGLQDTNLNTLSIQTPRGRKLLGHIKKE